MANEVVTTLVADDQLAAQLQAATTNIVAYAEQGNTSLAEVGEGFKKLADDGGDDLERLRGETQAFIHQLGELEETQKRATVSGHGLYRAELAIAYGTEMLGHAVATQNAALGQGIEQIGGTIQVVGIASHSYVGLKTVIDSVRNSQIGLNLVSGPVGWAALAATAVAAGAAWLYYKVSADTAAESQKKLNEERKKSDEQSLKDYERQEKTPTAQEKELKNEIEKQSAATKKASADYQAAVKEYAFAKDQLRQATKRNKEVGSWSTAGYQTGADIDATSEASTAKAKEEADAKEKLMAANNALVKSQEELAKISVDAEAERQAERQAKAHEKLIDKINEETKALERKAAVLKGDEASVHRDELAKVATDDKGSNALQAYDTAQANLVDAEASKKAADEAKKHGEIVQKLMDHLREEKLALTDGAEAKERYALATAGLTQKEIEAAMAVWKEVEAQREANKAAEEAKRKKESDEKAQDNRAEAITKSVMTPLEKYKEEIKEIDALEKLHHDTTKQHELDLQDVTKKGHEAAVRGIDEETAARARQKAVEQFMASDMKSQKSQERTGQLEDMHSAYQRIQTAAAGGTHDPQKELVELQKRGNAYLEKIANKHEPHSEHRQHKSRIGA